MSACCGHLDSSAYLLLSAHLRKINIIRKSVCAKQFADIHMCRFGLRRAVEERYHFRQMLKAVHLYAIHDRRLVGVLGGNNHSAKTVVLGCQCNRQTAVNRAQMTIKRKFAQDKELREQLALHQLCCSQLTYRKGKVECRTFLLKVGWRHVNRVLALWQTDAGHLYSRLNTLMTFLDRHIGQAY